MLSELLEKEKILLLECLDDGKETCLRGLRKNIIDQDPQAIVVQIYTDRLMEIQILKEKVKKLL